MATVDELGLVKEAEREIYEDLKDAAIEQAKILLIQRQKLVTALHLIDDKLTSLENAELNVYE